MIDGHADQTFCIAYFTVNVLLSTPVWRLSFGFVVFLARPRRLCSVRYVFVFVFVYTRFTRIPRWASRSASNIRARSQAASPQWPLDYLCRFL